MCQPTKIQLALPLPREARAKVKPAKAGMGKPRAGLWGRVEDGSSIPWVSKVHDIDG